jgi:hypothetical protein
MMALMISSDDACVLPYHQNPPIHPTTLTHTPSSHDDGTDPSGDNTHPDPDFDVLDDYISDLHSQYFGDIVDDISGTKLFEEEGDLKLFPIVPSPPAKVIAAPSPTRSHKRTAHVTSISSPSTQQRPRVHFNFPTPPTPTLTNKSSKTQRAQAALVAVWSRLHLTCDDAPAIIDAILSSNANRSDNQSRVTQIHDILTEYNANSKYLLRVLIPRLLEAAVDREMRDSTSLMANDEVWSVSDGRINRGAPKTFFVEAVLGLSKSQVPDVQANRLNLTSGQALLEALLEYDRGLFVGAYPS